MLSALRSRSSSALTFLPRARKFSTPVDVALHSPSAAAKAPGALRPHLGIPVNPNHGLYAFFRKKEVNGEISYQALEDSDGLLPSTGRSWTAAELRRKSFRDLHTLWYVLLRERNLLASQWEELRRVTGAPSAVGGTVGSREYQCRKSMARIKYVINERRLAYEGAVKIFAEQKIPMTEVSPRKQKTQTKKNAKEEGDTLSEAPIMLEGLLM